ncbi:MAG: outer membrane lipoprotein chaperone LolA [Tepidimonas ignava]|uniref:Outer-membrane lipoprotein carrier protein n=1 Tax=Tepidimonas ignava TaxID=114249 RepID=A0A4R3L476_9BURK|nr:outer membrane lipoprotein chaperone LolA [Tepidimonas ignava]MCX7815024.1 outer membrane lipoprotein chaperone LolA [Tepidimonas ignava]TCS94463.1 outer membrane lipoprotein carrier protein [Tepidimonas ignava]TSE22401.1 Outer-membrane lipoprotein carrier protein [Tepidimonas ignava]
MQRRHVLCALGGILGAHAFTGARGQATGLAQFEAFVVNVRQGQATFTQTVTAPPRQGEPARVRTSRGEFSFLRPDRFRLHYTQPFEQLIVADGQTLWLWDPDLNQVSARAQAQALANTPAALLASAADLRAVRQVFTLSEGEPRDGLAWVEVTPKSREGQIQRMAIGWRDGALVALDVLDGLGQRSELRFGPWRTQGLTAAAFRFQPPPGAEVLRP